MSEHYNRQRRYILNSVFGAMTPIEFEGVMLSGVEQPDEYLTIEYGNYMQLPPEDKRRTHSFHYLNLELPYRDYKPE
jgi:lipopolysaccharide cholinephosphotransferase